MTELKQVLYPDANSTKPPSSANVGPSQGDSPPRGRLTVAKEYDQFKQQIHLKLVSLLNIEDVMKLSEDKRRSEIRNFLQQLIAEEKATLPGPIDQERLIQDLLSDVLGLGPLEYLLRDPTISDILVNSAHEVYIERKGKLYSNDV